MCRPLPPDWCSCVDWITSIVALVTSQQAGPGPETTCEEIKTGNLVQNPRDQLLPLLSGPAPSCLLVSSSASTAAWCLMVVLRAEI